VKKRKKLFKIVCDILKKLSMYKNFIDLCVRVSFFFVFFFFLQSGVELNVYIVVNWTKETELNTKGCRVKFVFSGHPGDRKSVAV
jgi:hypothetical protein